MHKWVRITCFVLSLIVLALITLMVINTEVSLKYEIDELDTTDRIYIETADKYFKFKIEALTEFAIYVLINITIIVALFEKKTQKQINGHNLGRIIFDSSITNIIDGDNHNFGP